MSSYPILITGQNKINNNTFEYDFPSTVNLLDYDIALSDLSLYYSWYNISAVQNNNKFTIQFPAGGATIPYPATIPDGTYSVGQLNEFLQAFFITWGLYLVNNTTGEYVYYAEFVENPTAYKVQVNLYPVPTSLPAGFTNGGGIVFPTTTRTPQLDITNAGFGTLIGFPVATYPATIQTSIQNIVSINTPQLNPVSSVIMNVSCVNNPLARNSQLLHVFTSAGINFGSLIVSTPPELIWVPCSGTVNSIAVRFTDQNGNALPIIDTDLTIKLLLKPKNNI